MTEVFIVYFFIQSFTLHLEIDWITMFETLIWILYLVMPTFGVIYVGAITRAKRYREIYHRFLFSFYVYAVLQKLLITRDLNSDKRGNIIDEYYSIYFKGKNDVKNIRKLCNL